MASTDTPAVDPHATKELRTIPHALGGLVPPGGLLVSCCGTGGLLHVGPEVVTVLSTRGSTGLAMGDDYILRGLLGGDDRTIQRIQPTGIERTLVKGLRDTHDILRIGSKHLAVSTDTNQVIKLDERLGVEGTYDFGTERADCWHLNSLVDTPEGPVVTAFGRFPSRRGWDSQAANAGVAVNILTGATVVSGLSKPHSVIEHRGGYWLCNSALGSIVQFDGSWARKASYDITPGFTRGLCAVEDLLYVGVSVRRHAPGTSGAVDGGSLVVVDHTGRRLGELTGLPFAEIYDIRVLLPEQRPWVVKAFSVKRESRPIDKRLQLQRDAMQLLLVWLRSRTTHPRLMTPLQITEILGRTVPDAQLPQLLNKVSSQEMKMAEHLQNRLALLKQRGRSAGSDEDDG